MQDADAFDDVAFLGTARTAKRDPYRLSLFGAHLESDERPLVILPVQGGTLLVTDRRLLELRAHLEVHGAWNVKEFQDSPEVARAYDDAAAAIDDVLRVAPDHWKARMLKAALVFRRDRESGRPQALEILQALAAADPTNKQIPFTIRKIERPCVRCGDTGFCPHCKGRGQRRFLRMDRKCERCYGRGICPVCGVL